MKDLRDRKRQPDLRASPIAAAAREVMLELWQRKGFRGLLLEIHHEDSGKLVEIEKAVETAIGDIMNAYELKENPSSICSSSSPRG